MADAWLSDFIFRERLIFATQSPLASAIVANITGDAEPPPPPLWTRHMAGVREAERDRRRHPPRVSVREVVAFTGYARKPVTWGMCP